MGAEIDYEAEGLLDGLDGVRRQERIELLDEVAAAGAGVEEIRVANAQGRLPLLLVELALGGERRYSVAEIAERSDVPAEILSRQIQALGQATGDADRVELGEQDLEAAKRLRTLLDAGLSEEAINGMARVMAMSMSQFAAASREMLAPLVGDGETGELEAARKLHDLAESLIPLVGPTLEYAYRQQLGEQLRHLGAGGPALAGESEGGEKMTVAFADLVGFTRLGESLPPEELGRLTGRLGELASEVATGPVRLIKLIGDAAMFGGNDPESVVDAVLDLIDAVEGEGEDFPELRAGAGCGEVMSRGGDLYGRTVNLASRITDAARPGSLLVSGDLREALEGSFRFSDAGHKHFKGIGDAVHVYRCRELEEEERLPGEGEEETDSGPGEDTEDERDAGSAGEGDGAQGDRSRRSRRRRRRRD